MESRGRVLQGEAKKGQGQLKKVATEPKISILPLFGWRCLWLKGLWSDISLVGYIFLWRFLWLEERGRVLQGEAKRDKNGWYVWYCIILFD